MAPGACVARTLFLMEPVASLVEPPKHHWSNTRSIIGRTPEASLVEPPKHEWLNHHGNRRKQPHQAAFD